MRCERCDQAAPSLCTTGQDRRARRPGSRLSSTCRWKSARRVASTGSRWDVEAAPRRTAYLDAHERRRGRNSALRQTGRPHRCLTERALPVATHSHGSRLFRRTHTASIPYLTRSIAARLWGVRSARISRRRCPRDRQIWAARFFFFFFFFSSPRRSGVAWVPECPRSVSGGVGLPVRMPVAIQRARTLCPTTRFSGWSSSHVPEPPYFFRSRQVGRGRSPRWLVAEGNGLQATSSMGQGPRQLAAVLCRLLSSPLVGAGEKIFFFFF